MKTRTVLLVDDDEDIRLLVTMALESATAWKVLSASSGSEALRAAQHHPPDLMLLDVMMPGLDGPATLRCLRAMPETVHVPVIFLTARADPDEAEHFLHLGAAGVVVKPFQAQELIALMERVATRGTVA